MKVGYYVRTKNKTFMPSQIAKIVSMKKDEGYKNQYFIKLDHNLLHDFEYFVYEEDVLKTSPNIIDLIEVGDYINGHKVIYTAGEKHKQVYVEYVNMSELLEVKSYQIKSIVTKEMFANAEYRVETN